MKCRAERKNGVVISQLEVDFFRLGNFVLIYVTYGAWLINSGVYVQNPDLRINMQLLG
jgi:hypothetical protein